jgi:hypothetical protein
MISSDKLKAPAGRGGKAQHYYERVGELMATGSNARDAFQALADANGVSAANVKAGYARHAKANGFATTPGGVRSRRTSSDNGSSRGNVSVPKDLEPLLDAIRKDRVSLNANVDRLIEWAQAQEAKVASAVDDAREAALRQIRDAAANLK